MHCEQVKQEELAEKYLLGQLDPATQEAFEQHYFECARCFDELETYRALQGELQQAATAIRAEPIAQLTPGRWMWAAAAAVVALALGLGLWLRQAGPAPSLPTAPVAQGPQVQQPPPAPTPSLSELVQVQPPLYVAVTLRGAEDEARREFRSAMEHYVKGDYRATIPGLRRAVRLDPARADAPFFLGACYLLTGASEEAIASLEKTIALGDTPYLEEARFYLAKAYLRQPDTDSARRELLQVVELHGEREQEARALLARLDAYLQQAKGGRR